ncbi:hypothetical protein DL93DRAFT_2101489 [Clavulina sp. PMI_390]|nr:hypothetical protein DL93DRAFT_2101489 [Clavulina sp. PMI_390]
MTHHQLESATKTHHQNPACTTFMGRFLYHPWTEIAVMSSKSQPSQLSGPASAAIRRTPPSGDFRAAPSPKIASRSTSAMTISGLPLLPKSSLLPSRSGVLRAGWRGAASREVPSASRTSKPVCDAVRSNHRGAAAGNQSPMEHCSEGDRFAMTTIGEMWGKRNEEAVAPPKPART